MLSFKYTLEAAVVATAVDVDMGEQCLILALLTFLLLVGGQTAMLQSQV